jgi:NAD+ synthase (glutamine-hydrolysing)
MFKEDSIKIELSSPQLHIANPFKNAQNIIKILNKSQASFVLFPELCLSSYTSGDFFFETTFLKENLNALKFIINNNNFEGIYFLGMPFCFEELIYNVAVVIQKNKILGIVPKHTIPNYKEFNEKRWFQSGKTIQTKIINFLKQKVPFGNILFINKKFDVIFGVEICQDLWTIESPSDLLVLNGAHLIFNLSASTEHIGKPKSRKMAVLEHSRKQIGGYFYTSSGISESATDTLFSNHKIAAVLGEIIGEKDIFEQDESLVVDVFLDIIKFQRRIDTTFGDQKIGKEFPFFKSFFELKENISYKFEKKFEEKPFISGPDLNENLKLSHAIQFFSITNKLSFHPDIELVVFELTEELNDFLTFLIIIQNFNKNKNKWPEINIIVNPEKFLEKKSFLFLKKFLIEQNMNFLETNDKSKIIFSSIKKQKYNFNNQKKKTLFLEHYNLSDIAKGKISHIQKKYDFLYNINIGISHTLMGELILFHFKNNLLEISKEIKELYHKKINKFLTKEKIIEDFILYHYLKHSFSKKKIAFLINQTFLINLEKSIQIVEEYMKIFFESQLKRQNVTPGPKIFENSLSFRTELKLPIHFERSK